MPSGKSIKTLRILHRYLGLFFSPAILFFAFSGGLQVFNLHKPDKSTGYVPPSWILELAQIHKSQILGLPREKVTPAKPAEGSGDPGIEKRSVRTNKSRLPLQCFIAVMSAGLFGTTLLGIYMAFWFGAKPRLIWCMLVAGTLLPIAMLVF
ncbi:MAG TPA: PepSY domain-containing protein [Acidobacteriaceae bacterium]|jgi:hypothetical protein|nr:PepSY domain-containing protein [Acidobacteriaceae bacterium]